MAFGLLALAAPVSAMSSDGVCDVFQDVVSRADPEIRQGTGHGCFTDFGEGWIGIGDNRCAACPAGYGLQGDACLKTDRICFDEPVEVNVNRNGGDYTGFDMSEANAASCIRACYEDARCAAWTYVKPGIQAPGAQCWLKNTVPQAVSDDCCVSGKAPAVDTSQLTSTLFRIRLRSSYDITVVGGAGVFFVDVEQYNDGNWGAQRTTGFLGVGGGVSLKAGVSGPGDWQEFSVAIPARTADFKGTVGGVVIYPGAAVVVGVSGGLTLVFDRAEERVTVWVPGGNHGFGITVVTFLGGYWF